MMMMRKEKLLLLILLVANEYCKGTCHYALDSADGVDPCDPHASCVNLGAGAQVPNPIDCLSYYICITETTGEVVPSDHALQCLNNQYFDTVTLQCEREVQQCYQPCLNVDCQFECDINANDTHNVAVPNDCSHYTVCVPGSGSFSASCTSHNPYFNGAECGNNTLDCCQGCVPFCHNVNTETQDPLNCRMYYICTEVGVPDESLHFICAEGYIFDYKLGACAVGEECNALCSSSTGTTSGATQTTLQPQESSTTQTTRRVPSNIEN